MTTQATIKKLTRSEFERVVQYIMVRRPWGENESRRSAETATRNLENAMLQGHRAPVLDAALGK